MEKRALGNPDTIFKENEQYRQLRKPYLITVITIGILMIRGSRGVRQFHLFGCMVVVLGVGDSLHLVPRTIALCTTGLENCTILSQHKRVWGQGVPLDVADQRTELWLLHSCGTVGVLLAYDWDADEPQDLRLCVDVVHWIVRDETGMQIRRNRL